MIKISIKNMFNVKWSAYFLGITLAAFLLPGKAQSMVELQDNELSGVTGQALMQMGKVETNGFTFYKAGLDALVELNMNIEKLQLGCGGVNGPGCDIDIDNLSLSGDCANRPDCSAALTRPFFEFAIKNDNTKTLREISGFRLSAELASGLLSAGYNDGTENGINVLSGYMEIAATQGGVKTANGAFANSLTGRVDIGGCWSGCPANFVTDGTNPINIRELDVVFDVPSIVVNGSRLDSLNIQGITADIPDIPIDYADGSKTADITGCFIVAIVPLCNYSIQDLSIRGQLTNLSANIELDQDLGYIHRLPINNPFSLSFQNSDILWPDAPAVAQTGWWMSFADPVDLGYLNTPDSFRLDISSAYPQVAQKVSQYLYDNPLYIPFGDAVGSIFTSALDANVGNIDLSQASAINLTLTDLPFGSAQDVAGNCYGSATFC